MKCLVLSFLMSYNGQTYKKGDYVEVPDEESVKRLVRERCIEIIPYEKPKELEREEDVFQSSSSILNASPKAVEKKAIVGRPTKKVSGGVKKPNGRHDKL